MPEKCFAAASFADEAHVLTVGFGRGAQTQLAGSLSHLGLGQMSDRKQGVGQFFLVQHVHDITLIFGHVSPTNHPPHTRWLTLDSSMVASGDCVEAQQTSALRQSVKLQVAIALDAGVRCGAGAMRLHIWVHDMGVEVI